MATPAAADHDGTEPDDDIGEDGSRERVPPQLRCSHYAAVANQLGVSTNECKRLFKMRVPCLFLFFLALLHSHGGSARDLAVAEFFAGTNTIYLGALDAGLPASSFEVLDDGIFQNFLGNSGYLNAAYAVRRLQGHGLGWFAPVCSSWVFINRASSKRTAANPGGNLDSVHARRGNIMARRTALLCMALVAKRSLFIVEQPISSIMKSHGSMLVLQKAVSKIGQAFRIQFLWLRAYGHDIPKPTELYTNSDYAEKLWKPLNRGGPFS